jgi:nitroreductase
VLPIEPSQAVVDFLAKRRSASAMSLTAPGPDDAQLADLLRLAARVPDHGKLAPWRFIVYRGEARAAAGRLLAEIHARREPGIAEPFLDADRGRLAQAPLVVGVVSRAAPHVKIPEWEQELSAGAAAMNLVLAAFAKGFAAQWLTGWFVYDEEAGQALGLKPGERFAGLIHIGTPDTPPVERPRPPLSDLVTVWSPP